MAQELINNTTADKRQGNRRKKKTKSSGKLSLNTSSKDYDGNLGLPEKVVQREFETTGQFLRRLDRLVAKAKVEASLESRFDMTLNRKNQKKDAVVEANKFNTKPFKERKRKWKSRRSNNSLDDYDFPKDKKVNKTGKNGKSHKNRGRRR